MGDRERFFDRPTAAETAADRRARKRRRADQAHYDKLIEARRRRKEEVETLVRETDPGPWWRHG